MGTTKTCVKCSGVHYVLHLDGVTTYLKGGGRATNDFVVRVSYKQRTWTIP